MKGIVLALPLTAAIFAVPSAARTMNGRINVLGGGVVEAELTEVSADVDMSWVAE